LSKQTQREVIMRALYRSLLVTLSIPMVAFAPAESAAQATAAVPAAEWEVPWGGRPRDPFVAPDGQVFFVGQAGNYIARLNPKDGQFKRFEIDSGTNPHNLIIDPQGQVWYAGNRNGMIGKLDPASGKITRYPMPDSTVRDPHTLIFDQKGNIWFTAQNSNAVGHLDTKTGKIRLAKTEDRSRPYGIVLNSKGVPWFNLFGTDKIAKIDPATMEVTTFKLPNERARGRRIAVTSDDVIWYVDYTRGFLGRVDPNSGNVTEFQVPGGPPALPYALNSDDKDRLWFSENGPKGTRLVGFDPKTREFFGITPIGKVDNNTVRHMFFDKKTGLLWFGTDQGTVGRAQVSGTRAVM
jgi:virginiamycin B lyase